MEGLEVVWGRVYVRSWTKSRTRKERYQHSVILSS